MAQPLNIPHSLSARLRKIQVMVIPTLCCFACQAAIEEKNRGYAPILRTLHIDHCPTTGMIRGLLCGLCNSTLALVENYGFQVKPGDVTQEDFDRLCEHAGRWIEKHREAIFLYMQKERWLPRKDIVFHLQAWNRDFFACQRTWFSTLKYDLR